MIYSNTSDAYLSILRRVLHNYEYCSAPRGMNIFEILDLQYTIVNPSSSPIVTMDEARNRVVEEYTQKELDWYISGNIKAESAPSKFWLKIADVNGNITSNYGYLLFFDKSEGNRLEAPDEQLIIRTPYEWAKQCLLKDKDSRQALARINKPNHAWSGNKDFTCTLHMMFNICEDRLNISIVQRSWDMKTGFVYDVPFFAWVQNKMLEDLLPSYPNLKIGFLTHTIHSCHVYEKDIESIKKMIGE